MLEAGLLEEIAGLVERGLGSWLTATQAIGYAEFARHLADELTLPEGTRLITEGQLGHEFFALVDGEVDVTRKGKPVKHL